MAVSRQTPSRLGPSHCGQSSAPAAIAQTAATIATAPILMPPQNAPLANLCRFRLRFKFRVCLDRFSSRRYDREMARRNALIPCSGPISRRSFLQAGALSVVGLGLSDFLRLRALAETSGAMPKDNAVIFIWLPGGPAYIDTYDMKPDAPVEFRGDFRPIRTNVSGLEVCELFPYHAKIADKFTIIRSVCHDFADHGGAHKRFMTGRIPATPTEFVNDAPAVTSIVMKMLEERHRNALPLCIAGVDAGRSQIDVFSLGAAYLGPAYTPFILAGDPSQNNFHVKDLELTPDMATRLDDRMHLLHGMDRLRRDLDQSDMMNAMDR